jgi:glycosyltransferase involved in cell wall biosynthesis
MKNEPKVSVVMSVYNSEKYLRESVNSVLNQSFTDFEFVIINDGSTDGTREILESYNDPRIILIHQENMGLTKSLNKGITLARGEYIARQDADDISMLERLEKQLEFLEKNKNVALLGTAAQIIYNRGILLKTTINPCDYASIKNLLKNTNCFIHGSVMFKREVFFELGGYREFFLTSQDYDLWLRFAEKFEVANLLIPLYKFRFNQQSISFKKAIVSQRKMALFAKKLAKAREKGYSETSLIKELNDFLKSPLSLAEKNGIIRTYNHWSKLLLTCNKKYEAFLLMKEGAKYHSSHLYKALFRITKISNSAFILKILLGTSFLFERFWSFARN